MIKQEVLQKIEKLRTELFNLATDPKQAIDVRNMGYWISIGAAGAISVVEELDEPLITDEQAWNKIAEAYPDSPQSLRNTLDNAVFGKASKSQKPVVPKFVAEWFEDNKDVLDLAIFMAIRKFDDEEWSYKKDFENWLYVVENKPIETLIRMKDGYEVEKEPLYYVELPVAYLNHCDLELYLMKDDCGNITIADNNDFDDMKFTESEIKAIDERYWAFAVPVEEG
ncbi:DUF1642 domain-containing protein [Enterococcus mundtii]|uniref:DUF1642 domain-containing protein n=1 Tax=Enterococcus mundtii TaxID=53346 RepID=A0A242KYB6_ENTMU|nr:DUF1642 domain-containing protein [Enterococcus mundtii]OTP26946.1 hypothetical protein A5802_000680 [Enterococcus mundtii]